MTGLLFQKKCGPRTGRFEARAVSGHSSKALVNRQEGLGRILPTLTTAVPWAFARSPGRLEWLQQCHTHRPRGSEFSFPWNLIVTKSEPGSEPWPRESHSSTASTRASVPSGTLTDTSAWASHCDRKRRERVSQPRHQRQNAPRSLETPTRPTCSAEASEL